jgi:hypothetical protein
VGKEAHGAVHLHPADFPLEGVQLVKDGRWLIGTLGGADDIPRVDMGQGLLYAHPFGLILLLITIQSGFLPFYYMCGHNNAKWRKSQFKFVCYYKNELEKSPGMAGALVFKSCDNDKRFPYSSGIPAS